jgi:hypothetical protein
MSDRIRYRGDNNDPHFKRVQATPEEVAQYKVKHGGWQPHVYRLECRYTGKRIWGSGLGIGSHTRACKGVI